MDSSGTASRGSDASPPLSAHRAQSLSLSLPWRRPKTSMFDFDAMEEFRRQHQEAAADDGRYADEPTSSAESESTNPQPPASIKGMFRRASLSIRSIVHRRPSVSENLNTETKFSAPRPTTAHATWNRLRQATSFRHSRSFYGLDLTQEPLPLPEQLETPSEVAAPVPGVGVEPPVIPRNSGAAAKAAAAMQNELIARQGLQNRWLYPSHSEDGNDRESGIGISVSSPAGNVDDVEAESQRDPKISRIDFISELPLELAIQTLASLDAHALTRASMVSTGWKKIINNQHIWRESCLRETGVTYATSGPVHPNTGLGIPRVLPDSDWRQIYRAKTELNRRWRQGEARPVYLNGHSDSIYCLQFDEHKIITGSRDKTIRVWDMHTLECRLIIGPGEVVMNHDILYDEEGKPLHFATGSDNRKSTSSLPEPVSFMEHHKASILCLQYDDEILVTGSSDSTCIVYDIRNHFQPIRRLRYHTAAVLDLAFDEKHTVTCSKDHSICVWDRQSGDLLRQLHGHEGPVNAVQMRGNTIVSCSGDFKVKLWNIDTGKNIREFTGHTKGLACSQFSEDGRYVASAGNDKVIRIWDANTGECVREMRAHDGLVRSLYIDSVSGRLVSGSYDTDIKVWDMDTGHQLLDFPRWHASWVLSAKSDYRRIVSTGQDPKILIMDFGADVQGVEMLESSVPESREDSSCV